VFSSDMTPSNDFVDHAKMREMNLALILSCLRENHMLSRSRLAEMTGLTKATVSSLVKVLIDRRYVREVGLVSATVGRPSISLELNPEAGCIIGVEIGVDFLSVILTNFSANTLWDEWKSTRDMHDQDRILQLAVEMVRRAVKQAEMRQKTLLGIGIGTPGLVDEESGTLLFAPNLGWRNVPIRKIFEDAVDTPVPVVASNEADMAALGESYFGAARNASSVLYVSSGVGIGGGIVLDKRVILGFNGFAGEIGHMTIDPDGLPCNCGNVGCWETTGSQGALFRRIRAGLAAGKHSLLAAEADAEPDLTMAKITEAARQGDVVALTALAETGRALGLGIANLINVLNPEVVVFGGILSLAQEFLLPEIQAEVERRALYWSRNNTRLVISQYGPNACVIGGVASIYQQVLSAPTHANGG